MTERPHKPYHERQLNQQVLDALLRVEEILARAFPAPEATTIRPSGTITIRRAPHYADLPVAEDTAEVLDAATEPGGVTRIKGKRR